MLAVLMDAFGPLLTVGIPLAAGAFMWLFYREYLISDSFWVVVVALVIAGTILHAGHIREAALVLLVGIALWLWLDRRDRET
jgi:hypothetical protein